MGSLLQLAYQARRLMWRAVRPRTRDVKVMLFNDVGEVLLVRHSYGATHLFMLPGGGVRPWERLAAAAAREIGEELGCMIQDLRLISTHSTSAEGSATRSRCSKRR
ncbi:NUDIX domain-containing protein [Sphingomonas arvum]|uniref:NUDIX domain-containing protein n=1 Tax=Sphingomonas arvum TaxID=2992113 RepID=UPI0038B32D66